MTVRRELVVTNASGLHARPAARFVEAARAFESDLAIEKDGRRGNAKSLVSVLKLGINKDSRIVLVADGPDEERALAEMASLIESLAEAE